MTEARRSRGTGCVRQLPSGRWQARFRGPDGVQRTAPSTFDSRYDADAWLATEAEAVALGLWYPTGSYRNCVSCSQRNEAEDLVNGLWCLGCAVRVPLLTDLDFSSLGAAAVRCDRCDRRWWTRRQNVSLCLDCRGVERRWLAVTRGCIQCRHRFRAPTRAARFCGECDAAGRRRNRLHKARTLGRHTQEEWAAKIDQYGGCCAYCGETKPLTKDHVVPVSRSGSDSIDNIVPACLSCNSRKHARPESQFRALLQKDRAEQLPQDSHEVP